MYVFRESGYVVGIAILSLCLIIYGDIPFCTLYV